MQLITKASKDNEISAYCAERDLLIFGWTAYDPSRQYVAVRKMALTPDQVEREVVMEINLPIQRVSVMSLKRLDLFLNGLDLGLHRHGHNSIQETSDFDFVPTIGV
jgi:hypothetical protein